MISTPIGNPATARSLLFDESDNGEPHDAGEAIRGHEHARHKLDVVRRLGIVGRRPHRPGRRRHGRRPRRPRPW